MKFNKVYTKEDSLGTMNVIIDKNDNFYIYYHYISGANVQYRMGIRPINNFYKLFKYNEKLTEEYIIKEIIE